MSSPLQPFEYSLAPRVDQAKQENEDEDGHFDKTKGAVCLEPGCPREDKYSFNVEHHEEHAQRCSTGCWTGPNRSRPDLHPIHS